MRKIRILIANKYFLMNYAIHCILEPLKEFEVSGTSEDELLENIDKFNPDLLVIELEIIKINSFQLLSEIQTKFPNLKILVLLDIDNKEKLKKVLQFKLEGYLLKNTSKEELIEAAVSIYNGEKYYCRELHRFVFENLMGVENEKKESAKKEVLSGREKEILDLIVSGKDNREIADKLFISENTVLTHRRNIMRKLNVRNTPQLIITSFKHGLYTPKD